MEEILEDIMKLFIFLDVKWYRGQGEEYPYSYKIKAEMWWVELLMTPTAYFHKAPLKTKITTFEYKANVTKY